MPTNQSPTKEGEDKTNIPRTLSSPSKPKPKKKKRPRKDAVKIQEVDHLSISDKEYIERHSTNLDLMRLYRDIEKPLTLIKEYLSSKDTSPSKAVESRIARLAIREKGAVVMTEGSSAASDKSRYAVYTSAAIQKAVEQGDYLEAARLKDQLERQNLENNTTNDRKENYIHYLK